jgi:hypothetical protein
MPYRASEFKVGGKLITAVVLAALIGLAWASFETGRNPMDITKLFSSGEPAPAPPPKTAPPTPAPKPEATARKTEPPKTEPAPKPNPAPPAAPKSYSAIEMSGTFNSLDELLRKGRIFEAREKVTSVNKLMIPPEETSRFKQYEERVLRLYGLLLETAKGVTIEMPALTRILLKTGGRLVVKVLHRDANGIAYETITGIRSSSKMADIEKVEDLNKYMAYALVKDELVRQAGYKGIEVESEPGKPPVYRDKPGKTATGLHYFDLADFCAKNGANDLLAPLFDEALKRDPNLIQSVHELKAERMVDVLLYFLSINSPSDAKLTLEILSTRYSDTRAYQEHVAKDKDVSVAMEIVLDKKPSEPIVRAPSPPPQAPATAPAETRPADPKPADPPSADPKPADPKPADPPSAEPAPLSSAPAKVQELVRQGDRCFEDAMKHVRNSDRNLNPEGWAEENKKALDLFMKALHEYYVPAQDLYASGASVPKALRDRVRDATATGSMCRKRSVMAKK